MNENQPLECHKLTKKFFMNLPEGLYLVSNVYDTLGYSCATPIFNEYIVQRENRNAQWDKIKSVGADQRLCDVYRSAEEYKKVMQSRTTQSPNYPTILITERDQSTDSPKS